MTSEKAHPNPPRVLAEWPADGETLLTEEEAAALLRLQVGTLKYWRLSRRGGRTPAYVKVGPGKKSAVRYRARDLLEWLARQTVRAQEA